MNETANSVHAIYEIVRKKATDFEFLPDQKINEKALAQQLGASRTPVREALNRLAAEGFIRFEAGKGFFCRSLDPDKVLSLYEARVAVECEAIRLACQRATDEDITQIRKMVVDSEPGYRPDASVTDMVDLDEGFHTSLVALSQSDELMHMIANINARMRFVRSIDMGSKHLRTPAEHLKILDALATRNIDDTVAALRAHIERRSEEVRVAVKLAYSELYVPDRAR
jgi:DNA-binding GntR family transcriptional regulator